MCIIYFIEVIIKLHFMIPTSSFIDIEISRYNSCRVEDKQQRYVSFMYLFVLFWKHISPVSDKDDKVTFTS